MNLILLDDDTNPIIINTDNIQFIHYNKENRVLTIYHINDLPSHYKDNDADKIYTYLKSQATVL